MLKPSFGYFLVVVALALVVTGVALVAPTGVAIGVIVAGVIFGVAVAGLFLPNETDKD